LGVVVLDARQEMPRKYCKNQSAPVAQADRASVF
jgi:hypothetical protein